MSNFDAYKPGAASPIGLPQHGQIAYLHSAVWIALRTPTPEGLDESTIAAVQSLRDAAGVVHRALSGERYIGP